MSNVMNKESIDVSDPIPETKSYDFVMSLGSACIVADKLGKNNLRLFSGPFDWIVSNPYSTTQFIKHDFNDFLNLGNLEIKGIHENNTTYLVEDKKYNLLFVHDFVKDIPLAAQYAELHKKYTRRISNFYSWASKAESALFVIYFPESDNYLEQAKELLSTLKTRFPALNFDLMIVFLSDKREAKISKLLDNCYIAYVYHDESKWVDSDSFWRHILRSFSLNFSFKTLELSNIAWLEKKLLGFESLKFDNPKKFIYAGLSQEENAGRWSSGEKTQIGLRIQGRPSKMLVKCNSYKNNYSFVYVNGEYIGVLDFTKSKSLEKKFDISSIVIPDNKLIIKFFHDTPISPLYLGESGDPRALAVFFNYIKFS